MVTLKSQAPYTTLIYIVGVRPEHQEELLTLMTRQVEEVMTQMPGFISVNVHLGADGTHLIHYIQWESKDLLLACRRSPEYQAHYDRYQHLVIDEDLFFCDVAYQAEKREPASRKQAA